MERDLAIVFAKILPVMNHYICTSFGISKSYYGSSVYKLGGTGQGNSVSGAICRDTSCLIFKKLEDESLGVKIYSPIMSTLYVRNAIAFVDDTDFYTNGENLTTKMQRLMDLYTRLYEATRGKIQQEKINFYCWKWNYKNCEKVIEDIQAELIVHGDNIK